MQLAIRLLVNRRAKENVLPLFSHTFFWVVQGLVEEVTIVLAVSYIVWIGIYIE